MKRKFFNSYNRMKLPKLGGKGGNIPLPKNVDKTQHEKDAERSAIKKARQHSDPMRHFSEDKNYDIE